MTNSYDLSQPPEDAISRLRYSPVANSNFLLCSSWDGHIRMYDGTELKSILTSTHALLDCAFLQGYTVLCGGLSRKVSTFDLEGGKETVIGEHMDAVRCVEYHPELNAAFTGGWDNQVAVWDPRDKNYKPQMSITLKGKVFCLSTGQNRFVTGDSTKTVSIYDVRNLSQPEEVREQLFKYQIRAIEIFPNQLGFGVTSIEGRAAWEYFAEGEGRKKFTFKCHREKDGETEIVYPVNSISFHPVHGTFATGGGDGVVSVWDGFAQKRLWRMPPFNSSVTSVSFSASGNQMAIGVSYDFSQGIKENVPHPQIIIRELVDEDVRPKASKAAEDYQPL